MIRLLDKLLETQATHKQCYLIIVHQVFLSEKALFQQDYKITLCVPPEAFNLKESCRTQCILNGNTVNETNQIVVLTRPTDFMHIRIPFCIDLGFATKAIELIAKLFEISMGIFMPITT